MRVASVIRPFLVSLMATLVFVTVVLVSAGRITVWQAWVYAGVSLALNVGQRILGVSNPELAKERAKPGAGATRDDQLLLGAGLVLSLAMLVTAGLQFRFAEVPSLTPTWFVVGLLLSLSGAFLFLWALRENRFFSSVVRIQHDREHAVCTSGPYRLIRHPGNAGMIVGTIGLPLLFQSTWSIAPAALSIALLVVRTRLEDDLLAKELDGYRSYRSRVRFRLVPRVW